MLYILSEVSGLLTSYYVRVCGHDLSLHSTVVMPDGARSPLTDETF